MTDRVASLAALLQQAETFRAANWAGPSYEKVAEWLTAQGVTVVHWGDGVPPGARGVQYAPRDDDGIIRKCRECGGALLPGGLPVTPAAPVTPGTTAKIAPRIPQDETQYVPFSQRLAERGAAQGIGEGPPDATDWGLLNRAIELLMANEREYASSNAATDWYLREQRVLALVREVTSRGRAVEGGSPDPEAIREAMELEFKRIGINHHIEILHRVACAVHDALKRVAASQGAP